jgi:hypothetical protein
MILEEARETSFLLEHGDAISGYWRSGKFREIWDICSEAKAHAERPEELAPLINALDGFPREAAGRSNAMAAVYFTFQILTARVAE